MKVLIMFLAMSTGEMYGGQHNRRVKQGAHAQKSISLVGNYVAFQCVQAQELAE